jgi:hypothetical protein
MAPEVERSIRNNEQTSESLQSCHTMSLGNGLPKLRTPHRKRRFILVAGVILAVLDLPITYYYALKFDTNLSLQDSKVK